MKQRWVLISLISLLCVVVFCQVATTLQVLSLGELPLNFVAAFLEAVITAVITVVLLTGQSNAEEVKERNVKIFEKKSELFFDYIDKLWKAAEDQNLTAEEYEELRKFYSIRLMVYLREKSCRSIADYLKELGDCVASQTNVYDKIKENVFKIINVLSEELNLGGKIDLTIDKKLEEPIFPLLFRQAVLNELNHALQSRELSEGKYRKSEDLMGDDAWTGEYICFDFNRFKDCKLIVGPFSNCPDQMGKNGLWMWLLVERNIHEIDRLRYAWNKSLIEIWNEKEAWAELAGSQPPVNQEYAELGEFELPNMENWKGLVFDDPDSIEAYRNTYKTVAEVLGKRAKYWFQHGQIEGRSIKDFLETYLGKEVVMIKDALIQRLNWHEYEQNRALIGEQVTNEIFIGYERGTNWLGFIVFGTKRRKKARSALANLLIHPEFDEHFSPVENNPEEDYVGKTVVYQDFKGRPEDMTNFIIEKCQSLKVNLLLRDAVWERLINEVGFTVDDGDKNSLYKYIQDELWLCFNVDSGRYWFWFGVWSNNGNIKGDIKNKLEELFDDVAPESCFAGPTDWGEPETWLVKRFFLGEYKNSPTDAADYLIERYKLLEEKVLPILTSHRENGKSS
ncbi:hypothetical protein Holit_00690 [Hollandina sp. SP2]